MTTTASQGFTAVATTGSGGGGWTGASNLKHFVDGTASASVTIGYTYGTHTLRLALPNWASSIAAGSTLDSLTLTYKARGTATSGSMSGQTAHCSVTGGSTFSKSFGAGAFSTTTVTYTGDKDYWGWTSKTTQDALADLLDGTAKMELYIGCSGPLYTVADYDVKDVEVQIDYTTPATASGAATKGGAPIVCHP